MSERSTSAFPASNRTLTFQGRRREANDGNRQDWNRYDRMKRHSNCANSTRGHPQTPAMAWWPPLTMLGHSVVNVKGDKRVNKIPRHGRVAQERVSRQDDPRKREIEETAWQRITRKRVTLLLEKVLFLRRERNEHRMTSLRDGA